MAHNNTNKKRPWRGGNRKNKQNRRPELERIKFKIPEGIGPFCHNPISDFSTAIARREDGDPSHFDCVIADLAAKEELGSDEKICYLGNGSFGIIKESLNSRTNRIFIRKRIQYEAADKKSEWRRDISEQVLNKLK